MQSVMSHQFSKVPAPQIERSVFNRSHGHKTTFDAGYLIPFYLDEILPGDTLKLKATIFARLSTMIFPIMDNVFLDTFYFFVPARLLWENWERFNGAQTSPGASTDFLIPTLFQEPNGSGGLQFDSGTIYDYFGLPIDKDYSANERCNALPLRAYNFIWNEWFRDQNLQNSVNVPIDDGPDDITSGANYTLLKRGKRHDYFTSCLPWPQKGDAVSIGLSGVIDAQGDGFAMGFNDGNNNLGLYAAATTGDLRVSTGGLGLSIGTAPVTTGTSDSEALGLTLDAAESHIKVDLSQATAITINQLREAFQFQKILERDARGGTRYTEMLKAHFGVVSPDFRLQRPEYLGGHSQRIDVKAVAQTSESGTTKQGNLAAYGNIGSQSGFNKSFVEHGYIIGLVNVRSDITYQEGLNKLWSRSTRFDFYLPALAHLGEQAVLNKEIFMPDGGANRNGVFGYQERWAEYRYKPSYVTGLFRTDAAGTLDSWHLATSFGTLPSLNASFIQDNPPIDRVIATPSEPHILFDSYIDLKHARPMPVYSVPGQIDRF